MGQMLMFEYFIELIHSSWIIPTTSTEVPPIILSSEVQPPALMLCALSFLSISYSPLCYTVGPCALSILYTKAYLC